jgi:hypothetical protein
MLPNVSKSGATVAAAAFAKTKTLQTSSRLMTRKEFKDLTGIVIQIIDAGFPAENSNPYFLCVYDMDGCMWPVPACLMGRNEIIRYVRQRFGDYAASSVAETEALTLH